MWVVHLLSYSGTDFFMRASHRIQRAGYTPLQLVVILAVLLLAMALLVPAVQRVRLAAARTQSINNLKQLGLAMHSFHDVNKGLPPTVGEAGGQNGPAHFHALP